ELEKEGHFFQLSLPTIILGCDYLVAHKTNAPIIILPVTMPEGEFVVEAGYEAVGNYMHYLDLPDPRLHQAYKYLNH
ncbi:MAG: hypothetical protein Q7J38_07225, partial [Gallionella sp.]|nr:hypothetical protein [Gallionella sp.]